jgi:uncharacterized protein YjcR
MTMTQSLKTTSRNQPLGAAELAIMFGVQPDTIRQWRTRKNRAGETVLPRPDFEVNGKPAWRRSTILRWAKRTGREIIEDV